MIDFPERHYQILKLIVCHKQGLSLRLTLHRPDLGIVSPATESTSGQQQQQMTKSEPPVVEAAATRPEGLLTSDRKIAMIQNKSALGVPRNTVQVHPGSMALGVPGPLYYQTLQNRTPLPLYEMPGSSALHVIQNPYPGPMVPARPPGDACSARSFGGTIHGGYDDFSRGCYGRPEIRRPGPTRGHRSQRDYERDRNNNHVDIAKIREGTDVRTTVSRTSSCSSVKSRKLIQCRSCYATYPIKSTNKC